LGTTTARVVRLAFCVTLRASAGDETARASVARRTIRACGVRLKLLSGAFEASCYAQKRADSIHKMTVCETAAVAKFANDET
jgi:hypothetical protein